MPPIVFLLPSLAHGGAQKVFLEIAHYLAGKGFNVILVSLDREGELLNRIQSNLEVVYLDKGLKGRRIKRIVQWFRLHRFVAKRRVTNVVSTLTGMNIFTLSCFLFAKKVNITIREANSLENNPSLLIKSLMWLLYPRANKVIFTSEYVKMQLLQWRRMERIQVEVLPNPIDIEKIRVQAGKPLQNDGGRVSGKYRVIAVGRLVKQKGFDVLIDALAIARKTEDIKLVIVGEGPERTYLEEKIKRLQLVDDVMLVGYKANPYPYISSSDLFVLSSRWEGYVNTVIEAMALGVDIVATDCKSGPGKLLQEKLNYHLVPVESPGKLAEAILEGLLNPRDTSKFDALLQVHNLPYAIRRYLGEDIAG